MRSSSALQGRTFGITCVHSENGKLVVSTTAGFLCSFSHDLKQEFGADLSQRHVSYFVDRNQIVPAPSRDHAPKL